MQKSLWWTLVAVTVGSCLYYLIAFFLLPWAPAVAPGSGYLALQLANTAVLVALSLPVAIAIAWPSAPWKAPTLIALAIALSGLVAPVLPDATLVFQPGSAGLSAAADLIKFTLCLPLLTWFAVRWLPSNDFFKPKPLRGSA